jgi:hypothetical protein
VADNSNLGLTLQAWADIVIERWETNISRLGINHTGQLLRSFYHHVEVQANGAPELIEFTFEYYGKFVDMGVGRGVTMEQVEVSNRRPKPWYSKTFFSQIEKLKDLLGEKYERKAQLAIVTNVERFDENGNIIVSDHSGHRPSVVNKAKGKMSATQYVREYDRLHGN